MTLALLGARGFVVFNLVVEVFHRDAQIFSHTGQGDVRWGVGRIVTHAPYHVDR